MLSSVVAFAAAAATGDTNSMLMRRLYEACRVREQQIGRFPSRLAEIGNLLSDSLHHQISPRVEFIDPTSPRSLQIRRCPIGERAPCLRLQVAKDRWLNVANSGWIYESGLYWESTFVHLLPRPYSTPAALAKDTRPMADRFRTRSEQCGSNQVNLALYGNALPSDPWFTGRKAGSPQITGGETVAPYFGDWLQAGVLRRENLLFDVRSVLQLDGQLSSERAGPRWIRSYPNQIDNVAVGLRGRKIHLLAGTVGQAATGAAVAIVRLHFSSNQVFDWPLRYGEHLAAAEDVANASERLYPVTVEQRDFADPSAIRYSLHHVWLANPHPDLLIERFDFRSGLVTSHPFVLAVTVEP